jgi:hypothetical protein
VVADVAGEYDSAIALAQRLIQKKWLAARL